jgi:hypothetical protein
MSSEYYPVLMFSAALEAQLAQKTDGAASVKGRKYYQDQGVDLVPSVEIFQPTLLGSFAEDFWVKLAIYLRYTLFFSWGLTNFGFVYLLVRRGWKFDVFVLWVLTSGLIIGVFFIVKSLLLRLQASRTKDSKFIADIYWDKNATNNQTYLKNSNSRTVQNFIRQNLQEGKLNFTAKTNESKFNFQVERGQNIAMAQKGVSEKYLEGYLKQYFGDLEMTEDYFPLLEDKFGYTTDFSLVDPTSGLAIDLEVDEPYEGKLKTPHHCTDNSKDRVRNEFFLKKGWIVLRVSEFQVINQPESVCKLIAQVLKKFTGNASYYQLLEHIPNLIPDLCWNSVGVKSMVFNRYREGYLARSGIMKLDEVREAKNLAEHQEILRLKHQLQRQNLKQWRKKNKHQNS